MVLGGEYHFDTATVEYCCRVNDLCAVVQLDDPVGASAGVHRHVAGAGGAVDPRPYTLTMPTAQMVVVLRTELFVDSGRLYPCRGNPACSSWGHDLALSAPGVKIDGPRLVFTVHVAGSYAINAMFAPSIAGDLVGVHRPCRAKWADSRDAGQCAGGTDE